MQQRADEPQPYSSLPGVDPYVDWAFGAGSSFYVIVHEGREWLPVFIETSGVAARELGGGAWAKAMQIPEFYTEPAAGLEDATHCTALVTREFFEILLSDEKLKRQIARVAVGPPLRAESVSEAAAAPASEQV